MGKLIFFLIIIGIIYFFFKKSKTEPENIKSNTSDDNEFIQCEKCKTFVLKKEATKKDGKYYCKECYANS